MSLELVYVHVPNVSRRKVRRESNEVSLNLETQEVVEVNVATLCRDFISTSKSIVDFVGEIPYLVGPTKWTMFMFSCKVALAEECLKRLGTLGIGVKDGIGIVNIVPMHMQRISTIVLPKAPAVKSSSASPSSKEPNESTISVGSIQSVSPDTSGTVAPLEPSVEAERRVAFSLVKKSEEEDQDDADSVYEHGTDQVEITIEGEESRSAGIAANFMQTVKSRIALDSVVTLVNSGAEFSFDYVMLVLIASILACIGLVTDNTVVIVASMLVSPLMGPILAVTFGWTIYDVKMIKTGLFSELVGLLLCLFVGFIGGLCAAPFVGLDWPTLAMQTRAQPSGVIVGICIAIPSGVGVALSVLGNNTSSLVGVAISASLLPPAVNTGILLATAALYGTQWINSNTKDTYSVSIVLQGAGYSFLLTIANIVCIWISGYLMFKIKEVAPLEGKSDFWTKHVPNARAYNAMVLKRCSRSAQEIRAAVQRELEKMNPWFDGDQDQNLNQDTLQALNAKQPSRRQLNTLEAMHAQQQSTRYLFEDFMSDGHAANEKKPTLRREGPESA